jgi:membrane associated rhomboid family serine protease
MFALSIAFLGFALIAMMFALIGSAGAATGIGGFVIAYLSVLAMRAYWRRRPPEESPQH